MALRAIHKRVLVCFCAVASPVLRHSRCSSIKHLVWKNSSAEVDVGLMVGLLDSGSLSMGAGLGFDRR